MVQGASECVVGFQRTAAPSSSLLPSPGNTTVERGQRLPWSCRGPVGFLREGGAQDALGPTHTAGVGGQREPGGGPDGEGHESLGRARKPGSPGDLSSDRGTHISS